MALNFLSFQLLLLLFSTINKNNNNNVAIINQQITNKNNKTTKKVINKMAACTQFIIKSNVEARKKGKRAQGERERGLTLLHSKKDVEFFHSLVC